MCFEDDRAYELLIHAIMDLYFEKKLVVKSVWICIFIWIVMFVFYPVLKTEAHKLFLHSLRPCSLFYLRVKMNECVKWDYSLFYFIRSFYL